MKLEIGTTLLLLASLAFAADHLGSGYDHRILALSQQCLDETAEVAANQAIVDLFESVQSEYLAGSCSPNSNGVTCDEYVPNTILVELEGACEGEDVGGLYIGLRDYKLECETTSTVCENLGAICSVFNGDPLSCGIVPGCAYTGSGSCVGSDTSCGSRSYVVTSQEKPNCVGKSCECTEKAQSLADAYQARLKTVVEDTAGFAVTCTTSFTDTCVRPPTDPPNSAATSVTLDVVAMASFLLTLLVI